jgi:F0F1-type ATP synthase assembly protein I
LRRALVDAGPYLGIGSSLAGTVLVCLWAGHWLDRKYGTEPTWFLVGALVGLIGATLHFYQMYKVLTRKQR